MKAFNNEISNGQKLYYQYVRLCLVKQQVLLSKYIVEAHPAHLIPVALKVKACPKNLILNPMMHGNFAKIYLHSSYFSSVQFSFLLSTALVRLVLVFLNVCTVHYCYCVVFMHTFSNFFFQLSLLRTTFKCFHKPQIETQIAKNGPH